jgi:virulence-associated protein VapD
LILSEGVQCNGVGWWWTVTVTVTVMLMLKKFTFFDSCVSTIG